MISIDYERKFRRKIFIDSSILSKLIIEQNLKNAIKNNQRKLI